MNARDRAQLHAGDDDGRGEARRPVLVVTPRTPQPRVPFDQWLLDLDAFVDDPANMEGALAWLEHAHRPEVPPPKSIVGLVSAVHRGSLDADMMVRLARQGVSVWSRPEAVPRGADGQALRSAALQGLSALVAAHVSGGRQQVVPRALTPYDVPPFQVDDATWDALAARAKKPTEEDD